MQKFPFIASNMEATRCWSHAHHHRTLQTPADGRCGRALCTARARSQGPSATAACQERPVRRSGGVTRTGGFWSRPVMHADETGRFTWGDFLEEACIRSPGVGFPQNKRKRSQRSKASVCGGAGDAGDSPSAASVIDLQGQLLRGPRVHRLGRDPNGRLLPSEHLLPLAEVVPGDRERW